MPELSNLLRQRLAGTKNGPDPVHPDADTLTAYVEQSLPATERQAVIAHLSVCGPCREVVVLSQSELPELATQTVLAPTPVSRWRRLLRPAFGLAASVASMGVAFACCTSLFDELADCCADFCGSCSTSTAMIAMDATEAASPKAGRSRRLQRETGVGANTVWVANCGSSDWLRTTTSRQGPHTERCAITACRSVAGSDCST